MRLSLAIVGLISMATGMFGGANFVPPPNADPGGVNACWLALILMIVCGLIFVMIAVRRRG